MTDHTGHPATRLLCAAEAATADEIAAYQADRADWIDYINDHIDHGQHIAYPCFDHWHTGGPGVPAPSSEDHMTQHEAVDALTGRNTRQHPLDLYNANPAAQAAVTAGLELAAESTAEMRLVKASTVHTRKADWVWEYDGRGRILKAAITLFGGRPAAGKSTAARWFAAGWTQGTLPGCWEGQPVNVAYIATEEAWHYTVAPSLKAAGADMDRVYFIERNGDPARIRSITDEAALAKMFTAKNIRAVFLDPLMGTITGDADINRNNEVRDYLDPWVRIAEAIDGTVVGICHMTKAPTGDVVASITGSSAFGELARCVFGFAIDREADDGTRVMSQAKNSAGFEDLSLAYRIGSHRVKLDDGNTDDVARFELIGPTETTVRELLIAERSSHTRSGTDECKKWLKGYLAATGRVPREDVLAAAAELGFSAKMLRTAGHRIGVHIERTREVPSRTFWSLRKAAQ
ncbi:hypothetical protein MPUL_53350 [Mycolicibacterium pulveris]|uniref:AAA family ATPase n=2 Tax=Mycolicibacterium pulveris TaxID=36813 RepID=A0A7I7US24_MYCPV|nr:hypothetical protein MPUL_53350 [Mycolicibacterium pulveris]